MCLPNGSCTGAVGMLTNNDVDFAATEFMMTSDRLDAISFTTPIYTTKYTSFFKILNNEISKMSKMERYFRDKFEINLARCKIFLSNKYQNAQISKICAKFKRKRIKFNSRVTIQLISFTFSLF